MCGNTNSDTINIVIEEECVWPGDTNYDQIVNNHDLLPIGLGFGEFGVERLNASLYWEGQACQDWERVQEENGMNYKHIDTDGNGRIDANDALAITANYGSTHNYYSSNSGDNESHISLEAAINIAETLGANNDSTVFVTSENTTSIIVIDLLINEEDEQEIASHGFAFDMTYFLPPSFGTIENVTVNFEDSWLGAANELLTIWKHIPEANKIDIGLSRFDKSNALGKGKIGEVVVEVDLEIISTEISQLDFEMSNISLVLSNNTFVPVGSIENTFTFIGEDACMTPTNLYENDLTCSTVTLNWDAMPNAEAYQFQGRKIGGQIRDFPETQLTYRSFTSGLQTNTTYEWRVRTKCNGLWTDYTPFTAFTLSLIHISSPRD